ncbi:NifU family protein [Calidifontibacter terrae]
MTPLHAQAVPGRPQTVRWSAPEVTLPVGRLVAAPDPLGPLLQSLFVEALVEPHGFLLTLPDGESWRSHGVAVRTALLTALTDPAALQMVPDDDGILRTVVDDVLAGPTGDYVRSHGGSVQVREVHDGVVDLEFQGACSNCSAAGQTLHDLLDTAVRSRFPGLDRLHDVDEGKKRTGHFTLWPTVRRS